MPKNPSKYKGNEARYFRKVLRSEQWSSTQGSWVQNFEREFATKVGAQHAIAMNSGTSTLHAALEACGVGAGDEVITPALTVIMNSTSVFHANAIPVYADIDQNTFNIDPDDVERKIGPRTKAIVAVSLYGLPPDLPRLRQIADIHKIPLIEDNAQSFDSSVYGRKVGQWGDVSSWSFENTKLLSTGEGGMVTTNSAELAEKVRKIGGHGFKNLRADEGRVRLNQEVFQSPDYKRHDTLGWNYRMPEFLAAVGLAQLEKIDRLCELRKYTAETFLRVIEESPFLEPQKVPVGFTHNYYTLAVKFSKEIAGIDWREFRRRYVAMGGDGIYGAWSVPYLEPVVSDGAYKMRLPEIYSGVTYEPGLCPVAERVQPQIMQFKTNYRSRRLAQQKAEILRRAIATV